MEKTSKHIHPIFDQLLQQADKEQLLQQKSIVLWMTGLSGSGKSTIAKGLEKKLHNAGFLTQVLDGDNIRSGINNNLGFSAEDRLENIRRISEVSKLFLNCGIVTICSFVSPTIKIRQQAKDIIGIANFAEVFIDTPLEVCEQRDVKGLYKKARAGEIKQFTGIDAPFEAPLKADLEVKTATQTIEESVQTVFDFILPKISS
ncbi:MAG: adenylyl-sulfate kinase [Chitinophagales bacterium]